MRIGRRKPQPLSAVAFMRVVVAAVGRLKQGPERELAASYRKRAEATGRALGFRDIEVVEIRESRAQDTERRRVEEAIAIASIIPEGAIVVCLDERGENLDSASLAGLLREWRTEDRAAVCFIVGGADGLAPSLLERTKLRVAFGKATWPHQLVRIMLLEQIYRAATILTGHPYHRA
jgi:23S rRNA (pseudouridine1915-N3)-methyltransferase